MATQVEQRHVETELDDFTRAYIEAAFWSETDDNDRPLDANYSADDLAPKTLARMAEDCRTFQVKYGELLTDDNITRQGRSDYTSYERAGHDFWLTRNGHGCGFWDGDWAEDVGRTLTDASKKFGEFSLYVGDDGRIYA